MRDQRRQTEETWKNDNARNSDKKSKLTRKECWREKGKPKKEEFLVIKMTTKIKDLIRRGR